MPIKPEQPNLEDQKPDVFQVDTFSAPEVVSPKETELPKPEPEVLPPAEDVGSQEKKLENIRALFDGLDIKTLPKKGREIAAAFRKGDVGKLIEEVKKLKKDNGLTPEQLSGLNGVCSNLQQLMITEAMPESAPATESPKPADKREKISGSKTIEFFDGEFVIVKTEQKRLEIMLAEEQGKKGKDYNPQKIAKMKADIAHYQYLGKKYEEIMNSFEDGDSKPALEEAERIKQNVEKDISNKISNPLKNKLSDLRAVVEELKATIVKAPDVGPVGAEPVEPAVVAPTAVAPEATKTEKGVSEDIFARLKREAEEYFERSKAKSEKPAKATPEAEVILPAPGEINDEAKKEIAKIAEEARLKKEAEKKAEPAKPATTEIAPEAKIESEEENEEEKEDLFAEFAEKTDEKIIKGSIETIKIDENSKRVIDGFLAQDMEEGRRMFAVAWFNDHKKEIEEMGLPIEGTDDWKASIVLSEKKDGGIGILTNEKGKKISISKIEQEKYAGYGDMLDKIGVLRTDMARDPISPETPYLLLNYLQGSIEVEKEKVEALKKRTGDESAKEEIARIETRLDKLFSARKEIAEKILGKGKGLAELAEGKIVKESGAETREQQKEQHVEGKRKEIEEKERAKSLDTEWALFCGLNPTKKVQFWESIGRELPVDRRGNSILPAETENDKNAFISQTLFLAKNEGIEGPAFYGLLEKGFKPYLATKKIVFKRLFTRSLRAYRIVIPNRIEAETYKSNDMEDGLDFIKRIGEEYAQKIQLAARTSGEQKFDQEHERKVREEMEKMIAELANSPTVAINNTKKYYDKRRKVLAEIAKKSAESKK
jgi:hypothetical protein